MYRYIDFAVGNEFMMIAAQHGREIHPIVDAINRDYKRGGLKSPGLTGGPCLYKDGFFLTGRIPYNELIASAWKIHETTPAWLVDQVRMRRGELDGARVAVLGLSFKRDIDDVRNSLAFKLKKILLAEGADVHLHDPLLPYESREQALRDADVVFLAMNHSAFDTLTLGALRALVRPGRSSATCGTCCARTASSSPWTTERPRAMRLSIVVPVYREGENARATLAAGGRRPSRTRSSSSTTRPTIRRSGHRRPATRAPADPRRAQHPRARAGVALRAGFQAARGTAVLVTMADASDDIADMARMLARLEAGDDLVAASRYMPGGRQIGGPPLKGFLSRAAGRSLHWLIGLPTSDPTSAFKLYRRAMLERLPLESDAGFELALEITVKAFLAGYRVGEVPTTWNDRVAGQSNFKLLRWLPRYLRWYGLALRKGLIRGRAGAVRASL
jgi:hypothetical protein